MKFLLVEDDENKGVQLQRFLSENYQGGVVVLMRSLQSGLRYIKKNDVDLILLDMTLPNYDAGPDEPGGGMTHSFGGIEFLKQMDRFDISTPVVVVTQFETFGKSSQSLDLAELDAQLSMKHGAVYRGAVYYHASIHGWSDQLKAICDRALGDKLKRGEHD